MAAPAPVTSEVSSAQLTRAVRALATELRRAGAPVSPDEIALTMEALALVDLGDGAAIADVIQACLVKHRAGLLGTPVTEMVERWVGEDDAQILEPEAGDDPFVVDPNEASTTSTSSAESDTRDPSVANRQSDPSANDPRQADVRAVDPSRRTSGAEVVAADDGSTMEGLPGDVVMVELPADHASALAASADDAEVPGDASAASPNTSGAVRRTGRSDDVPAILKLPFEPRECRDAAVVASAILNARLRGPGPLRRASDDGPVDLTETLRAALRHPFGGLRPTGVTRRTQTGRLLVLLDVSRSVRPSTRFTLGVAHALAQHRRTRVVAFVADADDATSMLRRLSIDDAIAALVTGAVVDTDVDSDYPAAFARIVARFGSRVDRWTTVLIIGDGRSVVPDRLGRGPASLRRLVRRRATIWWWSPEPEAAWALGAGEMAAYVEVVDDAYTVRSSSDALAAVEQATRTRT